MALGCQPTIAKLGKTMDIRITEQYHLTRVYEIQLTADYLAKVEEEKERNRAERERLREEEAARRDFEREKARLVKERGHYLAPGSRRARLARPPSLTQIAATDGGLLIPLYGLIGEVAASPPR